MNTKVFMLSPLAFACLAAMAQTLPTGGSIVQGAGKIGVNGNTMVIDQSTQRMVADWQSFSIGAGHTVRFNQPSSSSVALNRVVGVDPSRIFGSLSANGHVYLQNPNGVLFAPGAQVDVGSLVATTLNASVADFMAGRLRLSGTSVAGVVNDGQITTTEGGHVVLAGAQVANNGSIVTPGGTTALAAGSAVNVDPTGAGLLTISVPVAAVGASLANRGTITADGGAVQLHAAAEDAARRTVMQIDGVVRARSIEQRDGQIVLSGGANGIVAVGGTLDASGGDAARGGTVKVLGDRVALTETASVDASGTTGGTVLLGGNWQGQGSEQNAQATWIAAGARVDASATGGGDGGTVVVWSDGRTRFDGEILARGGATGGDGGQVEVSGKQLLEMNGTVDTRAPVGRTGSLLLDPVSLEVGTVANVDGVPPAGDDLPGSVLLYTDFPTAPLSQITANQVATLLFTTDVTLQATGILTVTAPIDVAAGGNATTLTLNSPLININAPLTLNNAALVADTEGGVSDAIRINAPVSSLRSVALTSGDIGINSSIEVPQLELRGMGSGGTAIVSQGAAGSIVADEVSVLNIVEGVTDLFLTSTNNRIGSLTMTAVGNADIRVDNAPDTPLFLQGTAFGDVTVTVSGGLRQNGSLFVDADTQIVALDAGPVVLDNANNQFFGPVDFQVQGDFTLGAQGPLTLSGRGGGNVIVNVREQGGNGVLTLGTQGINTTGALIDLTSAGFVDGSDTSVALQTGPGGRFFIRSSNFDADSLGSIQVGTGANDVNHIVLASWSGAEPASGNVYYANTTGTISPSIEDRADVSKVYDGTTAFDYTQTGTSAGGTIVTANGNASLSLNDYTLTSTGNFTDKNAGTDKGYTVAATNNVVASGLGGEQIYGLTFAGFTRPAGTGVAGLSEITPRALTTTGITAVNRVYDATTDVALNAAGATLDNVVAGDTVALDIGDATGSMADKNAGTGKPVTVTGLALTGADAGNYTVTDASNATVDIAPRPITAQGAVAIDRVYDGTTTVEMDTEAATLAGLLAEDDVTIAAMTGAMADKNAGTNKPVTIDTVTLAGDDAGNYVATGVGTTTVNIFQRTVLSTGILGVDRDYDGTTIVALDASGAVLENLIEGDQLTLDTSSATGTMSDKNVGTNKPVTIAGLGLAGADAGNYVLVDSSDATVDISPRALTPTGISAINRVVDGTTSVEIDATNASVLGIVEGDLVTLDASGATGSVETPDPGTKPVFVDGLVLLGPDAGNYALLSTPVTPNGSGLTVRILSTQQAFFEGTRYKQYLEGVSDAQEPFRRAMAEALAAGFGKENIRKQLTRGLVFETGLAAPAIDNIEPAKGPDECTAGAGLACGQ